MKNIFLKDVNANSLITWDYLIDDIKETSIYNPYCMSSDYYTVFKNVIISLLIDESIILLDSDFTDSELLNLTGFNEFSEFDKPINKSVLMLSLSKNELVEKLNIQPKKWNLTLFTSGTTGVPKKVSHDFNSITRFVKISEINKSCIWGFAYNPTHMAGIQVFFQALLNGNSIVRLFGLSINLIHNEIKNNKITNISATPTFYKLLLPCKEIFPSVKRLTSGGEKFNKKIEIEIKEVFPNAKITNVYASTEAGTLFASENDVFTIKPDYVDLIRVENDELLIHKSLMGNSDMGSFDWYNTGDMIQLETLKPLKFRFVSRKSDIINVGGYKVNPHEVEEIILTLSGVKSVRVYPKNNSVMGNVICCELVCENKELNESAIRTFLQSKIQEFKIPRIIRFVDELSTTRTGKIKRN